MPLQTGDVITEDTVFVDADFYANVVYMSGSGSRWVEKIQQLNGFWDGIARRHPCPLTGRIIQFRTMPD